MSPCLLGCLALPQLAWQDDTREALPPRFFHGLIRQLSHNLHDEILYPDCLGGAQRLVGRRVMKQEVDGKKQSGDDGMSTKGEPQILEKGAALAFPRGRFTLRGGRKAFRCLGPSVALQKATMPSSKENLLAVRLERARRSWN